MTIEPNAATVLVVDDDEDHCVMLEFALAHIGYRVRIAHSVRDAVAILRAESPDVLVCDLTLGDGTAHDVMRLAGSRRPRLAIVLSGFDAEEERQRSIGNGFDVHLVKPTSIDELGEVLARGLGRPRSGMRLAKSAETADKTPARKIRQR